MVVSNTTWKPLLYILYFFHSLLTVFNNNRPGREEEGLCKVHVFSSKQDGKDDNWN